MIEITRADKYYSRGGAGEIHVLNDITLSLPERGMVAIYGKSGCGKTTLLNVIGGLDRLGSGSITVCGQNIATDTDRVRGESIGYIFQNYHLIKSETVYENVAMALRICGVTDESVIAERVDTALRVVGMQTFRERLPDTLSGGQQQRVAIARAIVKAPAVLLADEPTGNLDDANTLLVMDLLKQISREHLVLLVTHEAHLVDHYCDRVIELSDGCVRSVRENEGALGYIGRGKHDIYLGELKKQELALPGICLACYGEGDRPISLRVVQTNGHIYLQSDTPGLTFLEPSAEVKLHEGVYTPPAEGRPDSPELSSLTPLRGKRIGRLFRLSSSLRSGLSSLFSGGKKRGRLRRLVMILLAFTVVFLSADFGVGLRSLRDLRRSQNPTLFYLPLTEETDTTALDHLIGQDGIDHAHLVTAEAVGTAESIRFGLGRFMTANIPAVTAEGTVLTLSLADPLPLVAGSRKIERPLDTVITTALADAILEETGELRDYEDLLGLISSQTYSGGNYMRIVGVVDSPEPNFYLEDMAATEVILDQTYRGATLLSATAAGRTLAPGQVALITTGDGVAAGEAVQIFGREYTAVEASRRYSSLSQYDEYFQDTTGEKLLSLSAYLTARREAGATEDEWQLTAEWYFDYTTAGLAAFYTKCMNPDFHLWLYAQRGVAEALFYTYPTGGRDAQLYGAYLYRQEHGVYPTKAQYEASYDESVLLETLAERVATYETDENYDLFYSQNDVFWYGYGTTVIFNDEDYKRLPYAVGKSDERLRMNNYLYSYKLDEDADYYSHYLMIHAADPEAAEQALSAVYGDTFLTPAAIYERALADCRGDIAGDLIALGVFLALISLLIYFIMRSAVMGRVKEIGIYRAVGVSRRNLVFRFAVESLVLAAGTLLVGYLLACYLIGRVSSGVLSAMFWFPLPLALSVLALLLGVTVLCGTLPVRLLLRRTPSEILAKYDI